MSDYVAPLRDIRFVLDELLESNAHYDRLTGCEPMDESLLAAIIEGAAKFSSEVIAPLNAPGDIEGCRFADGRVSTPAGYKDAFRQYGEAGWQSLNTPVEEGGQGLPPSVGMIVSELIGSGCWAWSMYGGLAQAPVSCVLNGGTEDQKKTYLPPLLSGEWAGTMCLTEAHCGSDVGLLRTRAEKLDDGSYAVTGTKIFVSGGEQDITDNIIHTVLARLPDAPAGTKGVSLFLVPKILVEADGSLGAPNSLGCGSIEKKMGLKGSATCVMNFDGAKGFLLGEENRGLDVMFKLMNTARLGTAVQGLAMGELALQGALAYARERLQMRSLTGPKNPDGEADPIIVHPDVRRMLLTQKALVEGSRAFIYWLSQLVDLSKHGDEAAQVEASELLELLTPIAKAFCTEASQEITNLGLQVWGGHGYIADNPMEQIVRDGRISTVYEGTTGIQALDLVGRKVLGSGGRYLENVTKLISDYCDACDAQTENEALQPFIIDLRAANTEWARLTKEMTAKAIANLDELGSASVDYAFFSGYTVLAYMWARTAEVALEKRQAGSDTAFYDAKLVTARFFFKRILPRTHAHAVAALSGAETVMDLPAESFAF